MPGILRHRPSGSLQPGDPRTNPTEVRKAVKAAQVQQTKKEGKK